MKKPWRILVAGILAELVLKLFVALICPELEEVQRLLLRGIFWIQANDVLKPED